MEGHKKISRLLIDHKIVQSERNQLPVMVNAQNEIIAVGTLYLKNKYEQSIFIRYMGEE
ncbi:tRNA lysidine(34) synthetase TilS [Staphylococcus saprophyticus]|nr:tRNA lysidine(34) synthetase TilS [Staphylococcus saprophyticus]